ncbi:MAG TPA: hypothetical protein VL523_18955 [Terriglobia bacterium]|nr:hypothetical protein [Terriglobia bacterium]
MLSKILIEMIETHAEELTLATLGDLRSSSFTPSYHRLASEKARNRVYTVYRDLGNWLADRTDSKIETTYRELAERRYHEGFALSEVIWALILTKKTLLEYVRNSGLSDSAVELYRERELFHMLEDFFDRTIYFTAAGYEHEASLHVDALHASAS